MQSPTGRLTRIATSPRFEDPRWFMFAGPFGNSVPFTTRPQVGFALDGSRYGYLVVENTTRDGGVYTVSNYRPSGDLLFTEKFSFRGVPIPQRELDSAVARHAPRAGSEVAPDLARQFQSQARERMPPFYPPVEELLFGLDGTTWLTGRMTEAGSLATVLNGAGKVIGTVMVPRHSTLRQATASHIWVTERDADDLLSVVRYRVSGLARF